METRRGATSFPSRLLRIQDRGEIGEIGELRPSRISVSSMKNQLVSELRKAAGARV
jgi:hypothetical protein